jgi:ferredoxin
MTHIITSLCLRDAACVDVCPVECIVGGQPRETWPWFYIDPDTCIDCGACIPECPYEAIFPEAEVPTAYTAKGTERLSMPAGTPGFTEAFDSHDAKGRPEPLVATRVMAAGEVIDFTKDNQPNYDFFTKGPGYDAMG